MSLTPLKSPQKNGPNGTGKKISEVSIPGGDPLSVKKIFCCLDLVASKPSDGSFAHGLFWEGVQLENPGSALSTPQIAPRKKPTEPPRSIFLESSTPHPAFKATKTLELKKAWAFQKSTS